MILEQEISSKTIKNTRYQLVFETNNKKYIIRSLDTEQATKEPTQEFILESFDSELEAKKYFLDIK